MGSPGALAGWRYAGVVRGGRSQEAKPLLMTIRPCRNISLTFQDLFQRFGWIFFSDLYAPFEIWVGSFRRRFTFFPN